MLLVCKARDRKWRVSGASSQQSCGNSLGFQALESLEISIWEASYLPKKFRKQLWKIKFEGIKKNCYAAIYPSQMELATKKKISSPSSAFYHLGDFGNDLFIDRSGRGPQVQSTLCHVPSESHLLCNLEVRRRWAERRPGRSRLDPSFSLPPPSPTCPLRALP